MRRRYGVILTIFSSVQHYCSYLDLFSELRQARDVALCISDLGGVLSAASALKQLKDDGWRIAWRDHHVWDGHTLDNIADTVDYLRIDPQLCACEIVYEDLLKDDPIAQEIALVGRDRDFWINKDPRSERLSTVINSDHWRAAVAAKLSRGVFVDADIEHQYEIQIKKKKRVTGNAMRRSKAYDNTAVTVSNGYSSDVAALLRDKYSSQIEIVLRSNGIFSIRTVAPVANRIAKLFGGGGHPHAAGGNLHFSFVDRVAFCVLKYRLAKVQQLIRAAPAFQQL
jgi:oligoribonuclease NrnB/cAMP/cGMP phosphodiesterase (DHH superfamily)